jgi:Spy/CpxP family protein refolding chaperone
MNTKHYKILVWLVLVLLVLNIAALGTILWFRFMPKPPLIDQPKKERSCFRMHDEFIKESIGLDGAQLEQFIAIRDKHFKEISEISEEVRNTRKYQFTLLKKGNPDPVILDSLHNQFGDLHQQWSESSSRFLMDAGAICSAEQREKLFDMLEKSRKDKDFRSMRHFDRERSGKDSLDCTGERKLLRGRHK